MNKVLKIGLGVILLGIGLVITFGVVSGENFFSYVGDDETYSYVEKTYDPADFDNYVIGLDNKKVIILPSEDDQVKITYYESEKNYLVIEEDGLTLSIENETKWYSRWFNFDFFTNPDIYEFYLYLPDTMTLDLSIHTSNGQISVSDLTEFGVLSLTTSNGEVHLTDIEASGKIKVVSSNGGVIANRVTTANDVEFTTSNGRIEIDGMNARNVDLRTSNGRIECSNIDSTTLELDTSNGNIELNVPGAFEDYYLKMTTTNGNYYLNGSEVITNSYHDSAVLTIDCHTSNGNVRVNFLN